MCLHSLKVGFTKFVTDGTFVGLVHYVDTLVAVRKVGEVRRFTNKQDGQEKGVREMRLEGGSRRLTSSVQ